MRTLRKLLYIIFILTLPLSAFGRKESYGNGMLLTGTEKNAEVSDGEPQLQVGDVVIHSEKVATVPIILHCTNNSDVRGFQAKVILPEGLEFVKDTGGYAVLGDDYSSGYQITSNAIGTTLSILGFGTKPENPFKEGILCYFKVKAATDFKGGKINVSEAFITFDNQEIACSTQSGEVILAIPASSISLNLNRANLKVAETLQLEATVLPENATDKTVTWTSSNSKIIAINSNGLATAISVGEAIITATNSAGQTATITLTVIPTLAEALSVFPQSITLKVGENGNIAVTIAPSTTTNKAVSYRSANEAIATVDNNGSITGVGLGETEVVVSTKDESSLSARVKVNVIPTPAESVSIEYNGSTSLQVGQAAQLSAIVLPEDATDKSVTWQVQNAEVLSVSPEGLLKAVGMGDAWVRATTSNGKSAYMAFNVIHTPVSSIALNPDVVSLKATETVKLTAAVMPDGATNKTITWTSSDNAVASVDTYGNVTANSVGEAIVTATSTDGSNVVAECRVTVVPTPVEGITIDANGSTTLKALQTVQLTAVITPETATDKSVSWSSSNSEIASVDENGLVTAKQDGTATISAKSGSKEATLSITVIPTLADALTLNRTTAALKVSGTIQLTASFTPETTTDKTVTWISSNEAIATVNSEGLVTAQALGECEITATTADGSNKSASCHITVGATPAESISIEPKGPFTLRIGQTIQFSATVLPENATDKSVFWESQTDCVSIDANGLATALAPIENNWIRATNSAGQTDMVFIAVSGNAVTWSQEFECKPSDRIELTAGNENSLEVSYRCIRPDGGFQEAEIENSNGKWYATFPTEGAYILEAYFTDYPDIKSRKTFNVVNPDDLIYVDGIYYRYTDSNRNELKVVRGYKVYSGDYTIPASVNGLEVKYIDNDAFASCKELGKITITEGITELRSGCFSNGSISAIDIPKSIKVIEEWTFNALEEINGLYSLMSISLRGVTPIPVNLYIFNGYINYDLCELHVPAGTKQAYASAEVWKEFKTIIDDLPIDDTPDKVEVESVEILQGDEVSVDIGLTLQLTAKVMPENAVDKSIEWRSEDDNVATVTAKGGLVHGLRAGNTRVFAISKNGKQDVVTVTVLPIEADNIEINPANAELTVGQSLKAEVRISPENTTDKSVEWSVSDTSIISVDETGVVTAISRGQAYLFAKTVNGIIASALIAVNPIYVQSITIPSEITVEKGTQYEFKPEITPGNASVKQLVWESSNPSLGSFNGNVFYAHARGEVMATCRTVDGSDVFAQCNIKIETYAKSLTLNEHDLKLEEDGTFQLVATVEPIDAVDSGPIVWDSSNTASVSVDKDGLISALAEGESIITARTQYYPWASDECRIEVSKISGIETISIDEAKVVIDGRIITVDKLISGTTVRLIDLDGRVRSFSYSDQPIQITVEQSGIYILSLGKYSLKIAVR